MSSAAAEINYSCALNAKMSFFKKEEKEEVKTLCILA